MLPRHASTSAVVLLQDPLAVGGNRKATTGAFWPGRAGAWLFAATGAYVSWVATSV